MNFLHTFTPQPILFELGRISIYWYGFFMALAMLAGLLVSIKIAKWHGIDKKIIYDLFFDLIIGGLIGARIFYVLYNFNYFWQSPLDVFKIWQGGLAIHGALIFGILVLWWFCHKRTGQRPVRTKFWQLSAIIAPGVALGQVIGRWGNYFNQELFGLPTDLSWGIPIALANRPAGFEMFEYFHPTFLYESIGSLIIFGILIMMHVWMKKKEQGSALILREQGNALFVQIVLGYLLLYSLLRFLIEFIRIDPTAGDIFGMRATQGLSLVIVIVALLLMILTKNKAKT